MICSYRTNFKNTLDHPKYIVWFLAGATFVGTLAGALIGVTLLWYSGVRVDFFYFIQYWSGDALGILMIAPLILVYSVNSQFKKFQLKNLKPIELVWLSLIVLSIVSLFFIIGEGPVQLCFFFPLVMWAALYSGQRGVTLLTFLISAFIILLTAHGHGPFRGFESKTEGELFLLLFVGTLQITGLVVASIVMQREGVSIELKNANKELEKALKAREDFLVVASHELRTPLTPLKIYFDLFKLTVIKSAHKDENYQTISKNLQRCDNSLKRIIELTDELLEVSHLRHGQLSIVLEKIDLSDLVREVIAQLEETNAHLKYPLILNLDPDVVGFWDPSKLRKVIMKLILNAIKFSDSLPIEINVTQNELSAKFTIKDLGIGIRTEDQSKIFECFERISGHYDGSGMGLFISRKYVEAHQGTIKVESELGKGSTFTIELPLRPKME